VEQKQADKSASIADGEGSWKVAAILEESKHM